MTRSIVEQIADAVLYEGYILYPYRPSALKNRQRWNFGGLCPRAYAEAQGGSELWRSRTECLVTGRGQPTISVKIRFLQLVSRQVARVRSPVADIRDCQDSNFEFVQALETGGTLFQTWQEANEREIELPELILCDAAFRMPQFDFYCQSSRTVEPLCDSDAKIVGAVIRTQSALHGAALVEVNPIGESLFKVTLQIINLSPFDVAEQTNRDEAMTCSLVSSHALLSVRDGEFVSLLDPPTAHADFVSQCQNVGVYPVLVGGEGDRSTMLSSPVILYDYPKIAPESAGDLFDGTEIDEILTLRILALTENEKSEMRRCDERARRILDRIESDPRHLSRLHGAMRDVDSSNEAGS